MCVMKKAIKFPLFIYISAFLSLAFLASLASKAVAAEQYYVPSMPRDLSQVDVFLLTTGVGDEVANRFGHTGIRIYDKDALTDVVFNWGKFSFDAPFFIWRFFRGELTYSMGVRSFKQHVIEAHELGRRLWQDKINLTLKQKRELIEKIAWNAVPAHRDFQYQYWYKNCATIPRDYLDEVLGGAVRGRFYAEMVNPATRFRDYVHNNLQAIPLVVPTLDVIMNGNIDKPITAWQDMFLPVKLREHLLAMPMVDDNGEPLAATHLLSNSRVLLPFEEDYAAPLHDYLAMTGPLFLLLASSIMAWILGRRSCALRSLGGALLLYGLVAGVYGLMLTFGWAVSGHVDTWANPNLLLFWPIDFIYCHVGWRLLRRGQVFLDRLFGVANLVTLFGATHIVLFVLFVGLKVGGVVEQDVWPVLLWFGGLCFLLNLVMLKMALDRMLVANVWSVTRPGLTDRAGAEVFQARKAGRPESRSAL
jgi:hypothetical protein